MQIIIPMSGIGKRFLNAGYVLAKPLIEVDDIPMIQHVINLFPDETNFTFICNNKHLCETNMREVLYNLIPKCNIIEVSVENRQGPVHAVLQACEHIKDDDEVIVSYCDYGTYWNYKEFLEKVRNANADGAIPAYIGFHPHMLGTDHYAYVEHNNMWLTKIQEKQPFTDNKMEEYASNGAYYFKSGEIMKRYFNKLMLHNMHINGEYYVSMVYNLLLKEGLNVLVYEIDNMLQWGTPYDLEIYQMWSSYFKKKLNSITTFSDKYDTHTILPMAGKGSRFSMIGYKIAKPLPPDVETSFLGDVS
jgi:NDP-sugar pyrophosphorylase family protein